MINFSTLQGLTIPEGVVTEIKDASGRVLWSAVRSATVYLRPTAVTRMNHSVYPSGMAAYACINEEVADGDSTYIYATSGYSSDFTFSGTVPSGMKVTAGKVVVVAKYKDDTALTPTVTLQLPKIDSPTEAYSYKLTTTHMGSAYTEQSCDFSAATASGSDDIIDAFNALGTGEVSFTVGIATGASGSDKSTKRCITQVYIELTCEG